jgi:hypothetical protein
MLRTVAGGEIQTEGTAMSGFENYRGAKPYIGRFDGRLHLYGNAR